MQMFVVEMRNKNTYWIDEYQAKIVDQSWSNREPVKINGATINTVDISNIVPEEQWYELHPESKPLPTPADVKYIEPVKTKDTELWSECFKKNRQLLLKGELPHWTVEDGELKQKEYHWRDHIDKHEPVKGYWVKKRVSRRKWDNFYSQSPGYQLLENDGSDVVIAFVTIEQPIPYHLEQLKADELARVRGRSGESES